MARVTVVVPNYNGIEYIGPCLDSLREQTFDDYKTVVVDNGSSDGSDEIVRSDYPEVRLVEMGQNTGFTGAVNAGIDCAKRSGSEYVILLNNDTVSDPDFVRKLVRAMEKDEKVFSAQAKMLKMDDDSKADDAGDFYCALGWGYGRGNGKDEKRYIRKTGIFFSCGGAAIYRMSVIDEIGAFDDNMFAYLEDCDIGWRARTRGYKNIFVPEARVKHAGSASSGSRHNEFKISHSAPNSIYIIRKNMPVLQVIINIVFLFAGFLVKLLYFAGKGYGNTYFEGIKKGFSMSFKDTANCRKNRFQIGNLGHYIMIQLELWINMFRGLGRLF